VAYPSYSDSSGDSYSSNNRFSVDNASGVVYDNDMNLVWQLYSPAGATYWSDAQSQCSQQSDAGYSNWRLPAENELTSLFDYSNSPYIASVFQSSTSGNYWSSTWDNMSANSYRAVNYDNGTVFSLEDWEYAEYRCVAPWSDNTTAGGVSPWAFDWYSNLLMPNSLNVQDNSSGYIISGNSYYIASELSIGSATSKPNIASIDNASGYWRFSTSDNESGVNSNATAEMINQVTLFSDVRLHVSYDNSSTPEWDYSTGAQRYYFRIDSVENL
jgi:hypothetical protein